MGNVMSCAWCGGMGPESGVECDHCERTHMRTDYIEVGCSPIDEECAQVGDNNFRYRATVELEAFKAQLERGWTDGDFQVMWFPHDFGMYGEVVAWMHGEDDVQTAIAYEAEANTPNEWDDEAIKFLTDNNVEVKRNGNT